KITNGQLTARIWIQNGEVIDAETEDKSGEAAFHRILSWRAGNFESLPAEPNRTRTIFNPYQGLLLETAQAQDEAQNLRDNPPAVGSAAGNGTEPDPASPLAPLSRMSGVEFI